jgi:redox-sensitive bicupin YhaK (pirin superfamily)
MSHAPITALAPLGTPPWRTADPFLFCVHHEDFYPRGNAALGPDAPLHGRRIGMDFEGKDGWRMYHGDTVPGFPRHPHRGFETVTIARRGYIDHSDSLGATARFGQGDLQWMTAGKGVVHSEMFPLLDREGPNTTELFQLWLNLPRVSKMVDPYFSMIWSPHIPRPRIEDSQGRGTVVAVYAGEFAGVRPPAPPPDSWASRPESDVAIWTLALEPGARFELPPARPGTNRVLYGVAGAGLRVAGQPIPARHLFALEPAAKVELQAGDEPVELLLLQGRPIGEPVVAHGPFVMNRPEEIRQAISDYQRTQFGGWPWASDGPVHARDAGRFALHTDGRREDAPVAAE